MLLRKIMDPLSDCSTVRLPGVETEAARDLARARQGAAKVVLSLIMAALGDGGGDKPEIAPERLNPLDGEMASTAALLVAPANGLRCLVKSFIMPLRISRDASGIFAKPDAEEALENS